jgi:polysaccharide export outer membrane protein
MPITKAVRQTAMPLPLPRELDKQPLPNYTVEPGDVLLVLPAEPDQLPKDNDAADKNPPPIHIPADQPILPDGSINLGRYGRLIVAGKTVEEMEAMIRGLVQTQLGRDPGVITVRIVTRDSKVYYVLGEVNSPGAFQLKGRETVLDGIIAAGGLNDRASRENIILSRPTPPDCCRVVLPVCYREIVQLGDTTTNYQLAPGDRIYVPTRTHSCLLLCHKKCNLCERPQEACPIPPASHDGHPDAGPVGPPLPSHPAPVELSHGMETDWASHAVARPQ